MNRFEKTLSELEASTMLRSIPDETAGMIDLVSNDYLGLATREPEFRYEFLSKYPDAQFSSSASRLLSDRQKYHKLLEESLSGLYGKSILLFNSGFHANEGVLSALGNENTIFLTDSMMHASGWDGLMLAQFHRKAEMKIFPHNDMEALEGMIKDIHKHGPEREIIIVTESIFSMDGDLAPLSRLVEIKNRYPQTLLYLDEAHGFGVRGKYGLGLAEEEGLISEVDILIGTFGKAGASMGAFVATTLEIRDFLLNKARSFIFSTALPPINVAWSHFMLGKILDMERERGHLKRLSKEFGQRINALAPVYRPHTGDSQIIPFVCGDAALAVKMARKLRENGYNVLPIRRPSVPRGGERLRLSLNASLSLDQLIPLSGLIEDFIKEESSR